MAQIYTWNKKGWEDAYSMEIYKLRGCGAAMPRNCKCQTTFITYSRKFFDTNSLFNERARKVIEKLSLQKGSTVLVVGCALGYLMEEFERLGYVPYGFDNSQYINGLKGKEKIRYDIPNIDILSNNIIQDIDKHFDVTTFDCVITEDVLPSHDSFTKIFENCELLLKSGKPKTNIVHIVQENAEAPMTSYNLEQWKALNQNHTWLNQNGN